MDDPHRGPARVHQRYRDADDGESVEVVGGAVERIDHPVALAADPAGLLSLDRDVGSRLAQDLADGPLRGPIHLGHVVAGPLGLDHGGRPRPTHDLTAAHGGSLGEL